MTIRAHGVKRTQIVRLWKQGNGREGRDILVHTNRTPLLVSIPENLSMYDSFFFLSLKVINSIFSLIQR